MDGFRRVVELPVEAADLRGQRRVPRREAGPDFGADAAAHPFVVEVVVVRSRRRRMDAAPEIPLEVSVFARIVGDVVEERLRQVVRVEIQLGLFQHVEPEDLEFEVVVRQGDLPERGVEPVVEELLAAFQRRSDRAADAFPQPAAVHFVEISPVIHDSEIPVTVFRCDGILWRKRRWKSCTILTMSCTN
ncbi:hypothetical protein SDC9_144874 [bioreactor metagenome]|uniref:Uncharacterized protein n=1 Tax=bioreactor metagenome TaxID=1076179 RepID=A0A645E7A7_9ZZZZ